VSDKRDWTCVLIVPRYKGWPVHLQGVGHPTGLFV
jgi:hypothetical protein